MATAAVKAIKKTEDLTDAGPIVTVNDVMNHLEEEIDAIRNGDIDQTRGRMIISGRKAQLQAASLNIAAARLHVQIRDRLPKWLGITKPPQA